MKMGYLLRLLKSFSFKRILSSINTVKEKSGKSKLVIGFDMALCTLLYGAGHSDYVLFEYYNMTPSQRKTYLSRVKNKKLTESLNDISYSHAFDSKAEFSRQFKDYIGRAVLDVKTSSFEDFEEFLSDKSSFIAKPDDGECGKGIEKLNKTEFKSNAELYNYIKENNFGVCEEIIRQHSDLSRLYSGGINCVRVTTLLIDKKVHILYGILKTGANGGFVDNLDRGGLACHLDLDKGEIVSFGHAGDFSCHKAHPTSGEAFFGYKIPYCKEIKELVSKAALVVPQIRYIGWDVAITPTGPVIVEGNNYPGYDFPQLPDKNMPKEGLIPKFKALGIKI